MSKKWITLVVSSRSNIHIKGYWRSSFFSTFFYNDNQVGFIKQQAGKPATTVKCYNRANNSQQQLDKQYLNHTAKIDFPNMQIRDKIPATNKPKYKSL